MPQAFPHWKLVGLPQHGASRWRKAQACRGGGGWTLNEPRCSLDAPVIGKDDILGPKRENLDSEWFWFLGRWRIRGLCAHQEAKGQCILWFLWSKVGCSWHASLCRGGYEGKACFWQACDSLFLACMMQRIAWCTPAPTPMMCLWSERPA